MSQYMSCFSFTYTVIHNENEKYLKYFPMHLYLNTFVFQSTVLSLIDTQFVSGKTWVRIY